jgi:translation elongation factor EF-Tu-like GTPase
VVDEECNHFLGRPLGSENARLGTIVGEQKKCWKADDVMAVTETGVFVTIHFSKGDVVEGLRGFAKCGLRRTTKCGPGSVEMRKKKTLCVRDEKVIRKCKIDQERVCERGQNDEEKRH